MTNYFSLMMGNKFRPHRHNTKFKINKAKVSFLYDPSFYSNNLTHAFGSFHSLSINSLSQLAVNKLLHKLKLKMKTTVVLCTGLMFSVLPQPFFMLYPKLTKPPQTHKSIIWN